MGDDDRMVTRPMLEFEVGFDGGQRVEARSVDSGTPVDGANFVDAAGASELSAYGALSSARC